LVEYTIALHRDGCTLPTFADRGYDVAHGKQIYDRAYRGLNNPAVSYRDLTFDERMEDMEHALKVSATSPSLI
jgi:hypothetical protein